MLHLRLHVLWRILANAPPMFIMEVALKTTGANCRHFDCKKISQPYLGKQINIFN